MAIKFETHKIELPALPYWNIEEMTGYKPITTFWEDFTIAELMDGADGVKDTYKRAFEEWKTDYKYLTELVMVLNWKIWQHYEKKPELAKLYEDLYYKADGYALDNLKGKEKQYYFETTD